MNRDNDNMDQYYDNDLPKEVVELLMKTHPLKDRIENFDEEKYATRFTRTKSQPIEEDFEQDDVMRETKVMRPPVEEHIMEETSTRRPLDERHFEDTDDDEIIKMVKVKPRPQKSSLTYTQRDIDVEEIRNLDKEAELDKFFGDYDDDDDDDEGYDVPIDLKNPRVKKFALLAGALGVCVLIVLIVATVSLSGKLSKANEQIATFTDLQEQNSQLKLQINGLEEQIVALETQALEAKETEADNEPSTDTTPTEGESNTGTTAPPTGGTVAPSGEDTYTAVDGDSFWSIAAKVYGNGAEYQKILDANGLTENDSIKIGQVLKIPKQ